MNEDALNMSLRKFLKKVGITAQREIEAAIRSAVAAGQLAGTETLPVQVKLELGKLGLAVTIDGDIALE